MKVSERSAISPFVVMDVMEAAARYAAQNHVGVMHLEVGQPSTAAPAMAIDAARRILVEDKLGYTVALGLPALRQRISTYYQDRHQILVPPGRIVVTPGSSGAFVLAFLAAFDVGDRVGVAIPGYPCYRNILTSLGVDVVSIACGPDVGFRFTLETLQAVGKKLDGLIIASPANPTGTTVDSAEMERIAAYCDARNIRLISDEIYHGIEFTEPSATAAQFSGNAIVVNSFSKYYSMTGWRIGWMVMPEPLIRPTEKLMQNLFIAAASISQHAALAAFDASEELDTHVVRYAENRDIILKALKRLSIDAVAPADGAFYVYADVPHLTSNSIKFCTDLLDATGVAIVPGVDFDPANGHTAIRFSYATDTASIVTAMERFERFVKEVAR